MAGMLDVLQHMFDESLVEQIIDLADAFADAREAASISTAEEYDEDLFEFEGDPRSFRR